MGYQDYDSWGERLQSFVEDAVDSMNFDTLTANIRNSVQSVFDELNIVGPTTGRNPQNFSQNTYQSSRGSSSGSSYQGNQRYNNQNTYSKARQSTNQNSSQTANGRLNRTTTVKFAQYPAGTFSSWVWILLGLAGVGIFGLTTLILLSYILTTPWWNNDTGEVAIGIILLCLAVSVGFFLKGIGIRKRLSRFQNYVRVIGDRSYCQIRELSEKTGKQEQLVVKDLRKLIANRSFLFGHMDDQETCLMLDNETYQQYLDTRAAYHQRILEDQNKAHEKETFSTQDVKDPELVKAIKEGNGYIQQIRKANDAIPGIEISNKLFRLEALIKKIFEVLEKKPEQLPKLRKFMSYYMPTTLKLVKTYQELDAQPVAGENIIKAKGEIEKSIDTINLAYEKLLDSFFEDAMMDISTDITVLESMFAQEGQTKDLFNS